MTAKEFIIEKYPATARDYENKQCFGLNHIAYICEKYHKSEIKHMDFNASEILSLLKKYMKHLVLVEGSTFTICINDYSHDVKFSDKEVRLLKELDSDLRKL